VPGFSVPRRICPPRQAGFTYFGVLFIVVLMTLGLTGAMQMWSTSSQRDRERELLWVGTQYAKALRSYYQRSPDQRAYPKTLDELLEDKRFPVPVRHLRQRYADPITRGDEWGLVKTPEGRIAGVYSPSTDRPIKQANFPLAWEEFTDAPEYSKWRFVADDALRAAKQAAQQKP
jgi:type II secretory pathway pseudopilin PulG